ncbi:MAG: hypothetical protein ACRD3J_16590, partial [Thermoanaerobaculia bacterium]
QELRNAKWFGDFKSSAYSLSNRLNTFFEEKKIFSPQQILRMQEAEFISELLIALQEGIREKTRPVIDAAYKKYDDKLPNRSRHEVRIVNTIDLIENILGNQLQDSRLKGARVFYPLFCAMYHMQHTLPKLTAPRKKITPPLYPRVRIALEGVHELVDEVEAARKKNETVELTSDERKFIDAYDVHCRVPVPHCRDPECRRNGRRRSARGRAYRQGCGACGP